jgi:hypothetical protein
MVAGQHDRLNEPVRKEQYRVNHYSSSFSASVYQSLPQEMRPLGQDFVLGLLVSTIQDSSLRAKRFLSAHSKKPRHPRAHMPRLP